MEINDALNKFYRYLSFEKGCSESTISSYKDDLKQFFLLFKDKKDTNDFYSTDIETFLNSELNKGHSIPTALRRLSSSSEFYSFLNKEKIIDVAIKKINRPKVIKRVPEILTYEEVEALLNSPNLTKKDEIRDKAMLELMYSSGLRVSEIIKIKIRDLSFPNKNIVIYGTGKKNRKIPISDFAIEYIQKYITDVRRFSLFADSPYLFLSRHGKPMSRQYFYVVVKEYAKRAGIEKNISPHTLRHSFASHMLDNGSKLLYLKEILGHESMVSTQSYSQLSTKRIKDAYDLYTKNK